MSTISQKTRPSIWRRGEDAIQSDLKARPLQWRAWVIHRRKGQLTFPPGIQGSSNWNDGAVLAADLESKAFSHNSNQRDLKGVKEFLLL